MMISRKIFKITTLRFCFMVAGGGGVKGYLVDMHLTLKNLFAFFMASSWQTKCIIAMMK